MQIARRQFLLLAGVAATSLLAPLAADAESYPARPVRVIVPFAPGGPTDVFARLMSQGLSEGTGAQFYVENIVGAGGNIGAGKAAQAAPDGYTVLVNGVNHVVNPFCTTRSPTIQRRTSIRLPLPSRRRRCLRCIHR